MPGMIDRRPARPLRSMPALLAAMACALLAGCGTPARPLESSLTDMESLQLRSWLSTYNGAGDLLTSRDAAGFTGTSLYDDNGRAKGGLNALGGQSGTVFDLAGQATSGTNELGQSYSSGYNSRGWATTSPGWA